jgi:zinc/manganese transport system substrate-binding protein
MTHTHSLRATMLAATITALTLAGCAPTADTADTISVVATTNVYGDIAAAIGGTAVTVTSIMTNPAQDPHSFEADARVQLALSRAQVIIENGAGYDEWATILLAGANNTGGTVLNVADISGYDQDPATGDFNEHLWYDFPTVQKLVDKLVTQFSSLRPASSALFTANAATFSKSLTAFQDREAALAKTHTGFTVAITEPVPLYLLSACGFVNVTPAEFSEAIEEGTDVAPAILAATLKQFTTGRARILFHNEQTSGPQTDKVVAAATAAKIPQIAVWETLPSGSNYLTWMGATLASIEKAVG